MKVFHYLFESAHGVAEGKRLDWNTVDVTLPAYEGKNVPRIDVLDRLTIDERDRRCLVVVDGELLWGSIPKRGDCILSRYITTINTKVDHLRMSFLGGYRWEPAYRIDDNDGKGIATLELWRHYLLLPSGNAMFRRTRDIRSLNPAYVMIGVDTKARTVSWTNSTY